MAKLDWAKQVVAKAEANENYNYMEWPELCATLLRAERRRAVRVVEKALVWGPNRVGVMVRNPGTQEVWVRRADILAKLKEA